MRVFPGRISSGTTKGGASGGSGLLGHVFEEQVLNWSFSSSVHLLPDH